MATYHQLVVLSDTNETELTPEGKVHSGLDLTVQNVHESAIVYLGGEGVTTENYGYKLEPGTGFSVELNPRDQFYAISDTDESEVALLRVLLEDV
jgi:hypothetical protein